MLKISVCSLLLVALVFDVIPYRTSATPLIRILRSPDTTPESHISNFLHQHRADSRADKPGDHPTTSNASEPIHTTTHRPHMTTTEPPVSQTELLVNLIHNTIQTVRDQFPILLSAISSPRDPPSTTVHPKKEHHAGHAATHAHSMHERSTNSTSGEDVAESGERNEENEDGTEEQEEEEVGEEDEFGGDLPSNNNNAALLPSALIRTIVEASAGSAGRGSAGASAGLLASTSAGSSTSSSSGSGRAPRQAEEDDQGPSGSGEFLVGILRTKARALTTLFFAPFLSASSFVQRSIGYASSSSSGLIPEDDRPSHDTRHPGDHSHHHSDSHHHHTDGHNRDSHDHGHHSESHGHGHQSNDHGHHSNDHEHHSNDHGHHSNNHGHNSSEHGHSSENHDSGKNHSTAANEIESANLIFNGYEQDTPNHQLFFRAALDDANDIVTDDLLKQEASSVDEGPLRIVLANGNFDDQPIAAVAVQSGDQRNTLD